MNGQKEPVNRQQERLCRIVTLIVQFGVPRKKTVSKHEKIYVYVYIYIYIYIYIYK